MVAAAGWLTGLAVDCLGGPAAVFSGWRGTVDESSNGAAAETEEQEAEAS